MSDSIEHINKLKWQCRRGVLELDVLLERFLMKEYMSLSVDEKNAFVKLLSCTDQVLLSWFFGDEMPVSSELEEIVIKIKR